MSMSCTGVLEQRVDSDGEWEIKLDNLLGHCSSVSHALHDYLQESYLKLDKPTAAAAERLNHHWGVVTISCKELLEADVPQANRITTETCTEYSNGINGYIITVDLGEPEHIAKRLQEAFRALGIDEFNADNYRLTIGFN